MGNLAIAETSSYARTVTQSNCVGNMALSSMCPNPPVGVVYDAATHGASIFSNGTSAAYFSVPYNANLNPGTGNFTIEFWVYPTANNSAASMIITNYKFEINRNLNGSVGFTAFDAGFYTSPANTLPLNQWTHFAISRTGTTGYFFANGSLITSQSLPNDFTLRTDQGFLLMGNGNSTNSLIGYLGGLRLVCGTGLYTANFTPPANFTNITNTRLLFNNGGPDIVDSRARSPIIMLGNSARSTAQAKFGAASFYFPGTTGDYGLVPSQAGTYLAMGTGDFTMEGWVRPSGLAGTTRVIAQLGSPFFNLHINTSNQWAFSINGSSIIADTTTTATLDTWAHIALTRQAGTYKLWVNGVQKASSSVSGTQDSTTSQLYIGRANTAASPFMGYIDDFRITKALARYTADFTPPTAALSKF
jgi:hypothetical protein